MKQIIFFILFIGPALLTKAQKPSATVDRYNIYVGEQFELTFTATFKDTASVRTLQLDTIPHFEIITSHNSLIKNFEGQIQLKQVFVLTSWDSGRFLIPPFSFPDNRKTNPIIIEVTFSPSDQNQDYNDIKDILDVPKPMRITWYWYLAIAGLLIMIFSLIFPTSKTNETHSPTKIFLDKDVFDYTIQEMEQLKKNSETMNAKEYYAQLIFLFRNYLFKRKNISSHSKTTDDLSIQLKQIELNENIYRPLVQELRLSDFAKFARYEASTAEKVQSANIFIQIIKSIEEKS